MTIYPYAIPEDRGCCIPHDDYQRNQLLAHFCPSSLPGFHYLAITRILGRNNKQMRYIYGPVRLRTSRAWVRLMQASVIKRIPVDWSPGHASVFHPLDPWIKPAPSVDHFAAVVSNSIIGFENGRQKAERKPRTVQQILSDVVRRIAHEIIFSESGVCDKADELAWRVEEAAQAPESERIERIFAVLMENSKDDERGEG